MVQLVFRISAKYRHQDLQAGVEETRGLISYFGGTGLLHNLPFHNTRDLMHRRNRWKVNLYPAQAEESEYKT